MCKKMQFNCNLHQMSSLVVRLYGGGAVVLFAVVGDAAVRRQVVVLRCGGFDSEWGGCGMGVLPLGFTVVFVEGQKVVIGCRRREKVVFFGIVFVLGL